MGLLVVMTHTYSSFASEQMMTSIIDIKEGNIIGHNINGINSGRMDYYPMSG